MDFLRQATGAAPGISQLAVQLPPRRLELPAVEVLRGRGAEGGGKAMGFGAKIRD